MPKDRTEDRHLGRQRSVWLDPPDLWERLGAAVGSRRRSRVISTLIAAYLDGQPMPGRPTDITEADKTTRRGRA